MDSVLKKHIDDERLQRNLSTLRHPILSAAAEAGLGVYEDPPFSQIEYLELNMGNVFDMDNDGINDHDEITVYGTNPNKTDTDADGINDGDELAYWKDNWDTDYDGDGLKNLLDNDSDNDGFSDGVEIFQDSDPSDPLSRPSKPEALYAFDEGGGGHCP